MCHHKKITILPTEENSWGIADTFHIKCLDCKKIIYESIPSNQLESYIKIIQPLNMDNLLDYEKYL